MTAGRPAPRFVLAVAAVAAVLYSNFILDWLLRGFEGMGEIVSELESPGEPNAMLLRVTDCVAAGLVVLLAIWVRARLPAGVWREVFFWCTALFAIGVVVAAVVAEPCGPGTACDAPAQVRQSDIHGYGSVVSDTALFVGVFAAILSTWRTGPVWFRRAAWWLLVLGGIVSSALFGWFHRTNDPAWAVGASQRVHILSISVWIIFLGLYAARTDHTEDSLE
ncbi:DUF998 domain-containing protein [Cellulomonas rhizosphaerae]|uniref:DUF998 domain-containing protein n=1 Tax=Cellulomonas rhizosphaerae TaxID=2293719 RepID=A0A413RKZ9_9CELL|nr:DUF998 domain-containing protein [Cellulomonas rhizosphaerae]RHA40093.1 DUF998 domain-containing protein [Cellulomonas rhizosphaerae]